MTDREEDDLEEILEEIDEAFVVEPLSPQGDDSGLDDGKETDGEVPVDNLE